MVFICSIRSCRNVTGKNNFRAHKFPKEKEMSDLWLVEIKNHQPSYERTKSGFICSAHFLRSDYKESGSKKILKNTAIPSVFKPTARKSLLRLCDFSHEDWIRQLENANIIQSNTDETDLIESRSSITTHPHPASTSDQILEESLETQDENKT